MTPSLNPEESRLDPALQGLAPGATVGGGRFTLRRVLGQGGMAVVWLAYDEHLREEVALKFLPQEIRHDAVALDDLRRETARSRKLTHPHIIRIHDLYKGENEAFISMEFVEGQNLSELRLQEPQRVFAWGFLEPLLQQLCDALAYAHGEHVIHRDLKPANMMLDRRGRLKLADFGLAATVSESLSRVSMGNHALSGTASYMSPQQMDGQLPQVTDDIYALGTTLYELLTSRPPFFTGDIPHQVRAIAPQPLERRQEQLRIDNPVPPPVRATVMACLAKQPEQRPQSARSVAEQMGVAPGRNGSRKEPLAAEPAPAVARDTTDQRSQLPGPTSGHATPSDAPLRPPGHGHRLRRPLTQAAVVLALLAIVGASWWFSRDRLPHTEPVAVVEPPAPEFVSLFNGRDLSEWDGNRNFWSVENGALVATGATSRDRRPEAIFWRGGRVDDFELRLSFRLESGNSGIYYRAERLGGYEVGGYQFEIIGEQTGILLETGSDRTRRQPSRRGAVTVASMVDGRETVRVVSPLEGPGAFRRNDWNEVAIIVRGNHIVHQLNGRTVVDATDEYARRPRSGTVALEAYGREPTKVHFRDIRLKRLAPAVDGSPGGPK